MSGSMCNTCRRNQEMVDESFIPRISKGEKCDNCGRKYCHQKMEIRATVVNESGNEGEICETIDYQGDTPLEAVNSILQEYSGPRGPRVVSIDSIKVNVTEPVQPGEDRRMEFEKAGLITHGITFTVKGSE